MEPGSLTVILIQFIRNKMPKKKPLMNLINDSKVRPLFMFYSKATIFCFRRLFCNPIGCLGFKTNYQICIIGPQKVKTLHEFPLTFRFYSWVTCLLLYFSAGRNKWFTYYGRSVENNSCYIVVQTTNTHFKLFFYLTHCYF